MTHTLHRVHRHPPLLPYLNSSFPPRLRSHVICSTMSTFPTSQLKYMLFLDFRNAQSEWHVSSCRQRPFLVQICVSLNLKRRTPSDNNCSCLFTWVCTEHAKHLIRVTSQLPSKQMLLLFSLYAWEHRGWEELGDWLKVTQSQSRAEAQTRSVWHHSTLSLKMTLSISVC